MLLKPTVRNYSSSINTVGTDFDSHQSYYCVHQLHSSLAGNKHFIIVSVLHLEKNEDPPVCIP